MKTRSLTLKELNDILYLLKNGFTYKKDNVMRHYRPKLKMYFLLSFQVNTGLRIGDILSLKKRILLIRGLI